MALKRRASSGGCGYAAVCTVTNGAQMRVRQSPRSLHSLPRFPRFPKSIWALAGSVGRDAGAKQFWQLAFSPLLACVLTANKGAGSLRC
ncbi:hypothetical protein GQ54DRAFT_298698 [Martensiomyces pterosporus]|nr:hypothetical protein GQ54DRAFT_298698 [Martensiomyces pterosporus]